MEWTTKGRGRVWVRVLGIGLGGVLLAAVGVSVGQADGPGFNDTRPLEINQSEAFAEGQNQVFTYGQSYVCTVEPFDDLDGIGGQPDGRPAAIDPGEMTTPECIVGETAGGSLPQIDPTGLPTAQSRKFWAIVPVFDGGKGIPAAYDPDPNVHLQCPDPGPPSSKEKGPVGTCTMHPSFSYVDTVTADVLESQGLPGLRSPTESLPTPPVDTQDGVPVAVPGAIPGVLVPLPGHSHIAETLVDEQIWWQVIVVLVTDRSVWPDLDGDCPAGRDRCLTSLDNLRTAQAANSAGRDIPSNLWLFFANNPLDHSGHGAGHGGDHE